MRFYTFTNMYLSSLQVGLQSAHCISDIFAEHDDNFTTESKTYLMEWAKNHKTMILLNAGYSNSIQDLVDFFSEGSEHGYPWGYFNESDDALDGALTCVGIVLPERIYETAKMLREDKSSYGPRSVKEQLWEDGEVEFNDKHNNKVIWGFTKWEAQLCERLNQYGMAK